MLDPIRNTPQFKALEKRTACRKPDIRDRRKSGNCGAQSQW
jgi:hypothetical protein